MLLFDDDDDEDDDMNVPVLRKNEIDPAIIAAHAKVVIFGLILLSIAPLLYYDLVDVEVAPSSLCSRKTFLRLL